jgi:hypothetical protein
MEHRRSLRAGCLAMAAVLGLTFIASLAFAAAKTYEGQGTADPSFTLSFKKKKGKVKRFQVVNIEFACNDASTFRRDGVPVPKRNIKRNGKFEGHHAEGGAPGAPAVEVHLEGKIDGRNAEGTYEEWDRDGGLHCTTGLDEWEATKT